ncbi:MAG: cytochrome c peroxidase [Bdellovibrionota bacterium]
MKTIIDDDFIHMAMDPKRIELGNLLFFDKIMSGNQNISCATCHSPMTFSTDNLSLPIGEGGVGLGPARRIVLDGENPVQERMPRNAPDLFNRGMKSFKTLFHDGRLSTDYSQINHFQNPAGDALPEGFEHALEAQTIFPLTNPTEMAGHFGENAIADCADAGDFTCLWGEVVERLRANADYVNRFREVYGLDSADDISIVHVGKSLAAFISASFRADNSPFDQYLRGDDSAMSHKAKKGMELFYGKASCVNCHSGVLQTDQSFHAIAMPQIGPGPGGDGFEGHDDFGRERATGNQADRYKFRTPSLRNVELTAPYGHDGAYASLEGVVRHHLNPGLGLATYDLDMAFLPTGGPLDLIDPLVLNDFLSKAALIVANELQPVDLSEEEVQCLLAFLRSLTDESSMHLSHLIPSSVPSGLPIAD